MRDFYLCSAFCGMVLLVKTPYKITLNRLHFLYYYLFSTQKTMLLILFMLAMNAVSAAEQQSSLLLQPACNDNPAFSSLVLEPEEGSLLLSFRKPGKSKKREQELRKSLFINNNSLSTVAVFLVRRASTPCPDFISPLYLVQCNIHFQSVF